VSGVLAFMLAFMLAKPEDLADRVPEAEGAAEETVTPTPLHTLAKSLSAC